MRGEGALQIGRLRALVPVCDAASARLATEALLSDLDVTRAGLPPQSLLFVPRLHVAVPRGALSRVPDFELRQRVRASTSGRLRDIAERAVHPARGGVATDTTAVVFADEAELLACLARDGLNDQLHRWWWRTLLRSGWPDWTVEFVRRPHAVPAALRILQQLGLREPAVAVLKTRVEIGNLDLGQAAPHRRGAAQAKVSLPMGNAVRCADEPTNSNRTAPALGAEQNDDAVEFASRAREPGRSPRVRSSSESRGGDDDFRAADGWTATTAPGAVPTLLADRSSSECVRETRHEGWAAPFTFELSSSSLDGTHSLAAVPLETGPAWVAPVGELRVDSIQSPVDDESRSFDSRAAAHGGRADMGRESVTASTSSSVAWYPVTPTPDAVQCADGARVEVHEVLSLAHGLHPVRTRWGGLFFLVNVLLAQGIYPDFTRPRDSGFPIPMWRLLALIGRRLVGRRICADQIWSTLLALDEAPIGELTQRLETSWSPPEGSLPPRSQWRAKTDPHLQAPADELADWVGTFVAWFRRTSADELGWPVGQVGRRMSAIPAKVWITQGAIVVAMPLEALPVELRLAGFDRDPGFLPTTARSLRFVFE